MFFEDSWKISGRLLLNYGLRYEIESRIREPNQQTSAPILSGPAQLGSTLLVNPKPPYTLDKNGWGPRVALEWRARPNTLLRVGAGITTLLVNLYQDNYLTGTTPYVFYPRLTTSPGAPIPFGLTITPQQLPPVYTPNGSPIFAAGDSKQVPGNTVMDVLRFEQDLAALSPDHQLTPLTISGIAPNFQNGYIGTWTAGLEQKLPARRSLQPTWEPPESNSRSPIIQTDTPAQARHSRPTPSSILRAKSPVATDRST